MSTKIAFTKMTGAGNDFIVIDTLHHPVPSLRHHWKPVSRALCDRHRGIGADGVLLLEPSTVADVRMRVFNPDGSEAEMCGNGARCVAKFVQRWPRPSPARSTQRRSTARMGARHDGHVVIQTGSGLVSAVSHHGRIQMRMPDPTDLRLDVRLELDGRALHGAYLNTGVPHVVIPVDDLDGLDARGLGRLIRHHRLFEPQGANVDFIQADPRHPAHLLVRTYERGVEDETLACGTGVTASAVIHGLGGDLRMGRLTTQGHGQVRECHVQVRTRSGDEMTVSFHVEPHGRSSRVTDVVLEGDARRVFEGTAEWPLHPSAGQRPARAGDRIEGAGR